MMWDDPKSLTTHVGCRISDGIPRGSFGSPLSSERFSLLGGADLNVTEIILTFAVPYYVATYGAVAYYLKNMVQGRRVKTVRIEMGFCRPERTERRKNGQAAARNHPKAP
jgi:hypothetical protein